jgi:hypothetical protein
MGISQRDGWVATARFFSITACIKPSRDAWAAVNVTAGTLEVPPALAPVNVTLVALCSQRDDDGLGIPAACITFWTGERVLGDPDPLD